MMAQWMAYVAAVGALLGLAALAVERGMRALALPQRWVWAAAMVLTLALPAAVRWLPRAPVPAPMRIAAPAGAVMPGTALESVPAESRRRIDLAALDRPLRAGWFGSGCAAILALGLAAAAMARRKRRWRVAQVDGVPVLVSPDTGPAVVGLFRSRIVLPEWVVRDAEPEVRALLMEHEREHLRAGDPRLLALGLAMVALAPWNPAAWWQLRRLRLAMEVDCDARVLARRADVRAYGALLLEVGRRASGGRLMAAAFSEPASFLERRIRIMTSRIPRRPARVLLPVLALCAVTFAAMRALPLPYVPEPAPPPAAAARQDTVQPRLLNPQAVSRALQAEYPPRLVSASVEGEVTVRFTVTTEGIPTRIVAVESPNPEFAAAAVRAMQAARFQPATHEGLPVVFTAMLPVQFTLRDGRATTTVRAPAWDEQPQLANAQEVMRALDAEYPPRLRAARIEPQAEVELRVSALGEVLRAIAVSATHPEAEDAAVRALRRARFRPAQKDGEPMEADVVIPVKFELPRAVAP